jgi:hypothetical protein
VTSQIAPKKTVFISYRRADSSGHAGRICDHLTASLPSIRFFLDVSGIGIGREWKQAIATEVEASDLIIVVIGSQWLSIAGDYGIRRLDDSMDIVRFELKTALEGKKWIIPVLLNDTKFPDAAGLPQDIRALAEWNAVRLNDESFIDDVSRLAGAIRNILMGAPPPLDQSFVDILHSGYARHWQQAPLGDVVHFFDHKRQQIKQSDRKPGPFPYYGAAGIIDSLDTYAFEGDYALITEVSSNLVSRNNPIAFRAQGRFSANRDVHVVLPKDGLLIDFLILYLSVTDLKPYLPNRSIPRVSKQLLSTIPIAIPSLSEQYVIVEKIQSGLFEIDQQITTLSARRSQIAQQVFLGELTNDLGQN